MVEVDMTAVGEFPPYYPFNRRPGLSRRGEERFNSERRGPNAGTGVVTAADADALYFGQQCVRDFAAPFASTIHRVEPVQRTWLPSFTKVVQDHRNDSRRSRVLLVKGEPYLICREFGREKSLRDQRHEDVTIRQRILQLPNPVAAGRVFDQSVMVGVP